MSSDDYFYDSSFYNDDLFFADPFSPFGDTDIFQALSNDQNTQNPIPNSNYVDPNFMSCSPSNKLDNLYLFQAASLQPLSDGSNFDNCSSLGNGYDNFQGFDDLGVKTEECQMGSQSFYNHHSAMHYSYSGLENEAGTKHRGYGSNSFEGKTLLESNYQNQSLSSGENNLVTTQSRMACSTGDLQNTTRRSFSSSLETESSFMEEANLKVVRYSAEERKEKISKYRAKRKQRNFTKTIKTAGHAYAAGSRETMRAVRLPKLHVPSDMKTQTSNGLMERKIYTYFVDMTVLANHSFSTTV